MVKKFMNKKIVLLGLGLLLVITTVVVSISAWLTDTGDTGKVTFTIGEVSYTLNGAFISADDPIVPGEQLIATAFSLENESTVDSHIRFYIDYKINLGTPPITVDKATDTQLNNYFTNTTHNSSGAVTFGSGWAHDGGYWYYGASSTSPTLVEPTDDDPIIFLSNLMLNGSVIGNTYANITVDITITFQAKQADHVDWADLGSIDWQTGLPTP